MVSRAPVFNRSVSDAGPHQSPIRIKALEIFSGEIFPPLAVSLPQKTVGTTPCPRFEDSQILGLTLSGVQPYAGSRRGRTI